MDHPLALVNFPLVYIRAPSINLLFVSSDPLPLLLLGQKGSTVLLGDRFSESVEEGLLSKEGGWCGKVGGEWVPLGIHLLGFFIRHL